MLTFADNLMSAKDFGDVVDAIEADFGMPYWVGYEFYRSAGPNEENALLGRLSSPVKLAGRPLGEVVDELEVAAGWEGRFHLRHERGGEMRAGGDGFILGTRPQSVKRADGYVDPSRLLRRWWSPRAQVWWFLSKDALPMRQRNANLLYVRDRILSPGGEYRVWNWESSRLLRRLKPSGVAPATGWTPSLTAMSYVGPAAGLALNGTPEQLAAAESIVWRMEVENFAFDLLLGAGLAVLFGGLLALLRYSGRRLVRDELRRRAGLCIDCGYDLRGSADRCPECGKFVPGPTRDVAG